MKVSAKDLGTGKEQHITVTASSGLSDEEIDQMMKDVERTRQKMRNCAKRLILKTKRIRRYSKLRSFI